MIFYTLLGPGHQLEIHESELRIIRKNWSRQIETKIWKIEELTLFQISVPKFYFISGKIEWETFSGDKAHFRFTTNPVMVKKIEKYLQKKIVKNHQHHQQVKLFGRVA